MTGCATAPTPIYKEAPIGKRVPGALYHNEKPGETLWGISRLYGVDMRDVLKANSIQDSNAIEKGQLILIPGKVGLAEKLNYTSLKDSFVWPVRGPVIAYYGAKVDKIINKGLDIKVLDGTAVRASRGGKVVYCDPYLKGFGKTVILEHGDKYQTVYSYNSEITVNVGDTVNQSDIIARIGKTGRAKQSSLHFEIRRDGEPQNPFYYLPR